MCASFASTGETPIISQVDALPNTKKSLPQSESQCDRYLPQLFFDGGQVVDHAFGRRDGDPWEWCRAFDSEFCDGIVKTSQVVSRPGHDQQQRIERSVDNRFVRGFGIHRLTLSRFRWQTLAQRHQ
jgi:hypothetical protein